MDYTTFGESQEVLAELGNAQTYEFFGRLENLPIPAPDSGDNEILSGFLLLGVWNDHLVKSAKGNRPAAAGRDDRVRSAVPAAMAAEIAHRHLHRIRHSLG